MNCNQIRELLPDLAAGIDAGTPEIETHLASCVTCAAKLQGFKQTMALLDEWQAPADTSPYFSTRLRARLREEQARPVGWLQWFRKPALAVSLMVLMIASISLFQGGWKPKPARPGLAYASGNDRHRGRIEHRRPHARRARSCDEVVTAFRA